MRRYQLPDFLRMILDLRNLGLSHDDIACALDMKQASTISAWACGVKPFFENGEKFIIFWQMMTGIDRYPRIGETHSYKYKLRQEEEHTKLGVHSNPVASKTVKTKCEQLDLSLLSKG